MQWDAILREALQRAAPYVVWVGMALAASILVAVIREPLSRLLREAREQLRALRTRLLTRSAIALGRKFHRFWLARQYEPARTVAGSLDRLAEALPLVGRKSLSQVSALQLELRKQLGILEALGLHPPLGRAVPAADATPGPVGSWSRLLLLTLIAGLTGAANSFLLNEFFQGVLTTDPLFPSAFPDLHVSHVFAVLIFMMEVAIGFALHHFGEDHGDESAARRWLALAPWVVLAGLVCLEGWAYALLSYQIDIPERLNLSPNSGLYTFARYFLAVFGAGLTLLLSSLGYLLGREFERLQVGGETRRQERLLKRYGWVISGGADQVERTVQALARLRATAQSLQLDLVHQFKREVDATGNSQNLAAAVRDALSEILDSARQAGASLERGINGFVTRERRQVRTRTQALSDMSLYTAAFGLLVTMSWVSVEYVAAFVRSSQGSRASEDLFALVSGVVLTGFALSSGYVAGRASSITGHGSGTRTLPASADGRRLLALLAVVFPLAAAAGLVAIAVANRTLGPVLPLNILFGLVHAALLTLLGAVTDAALVNTLHLLRLTGLYLERCIASLAALVLGILRVLLAVLDWVVRLVAVFGQIVVRPRPAVRVGVAEVSRSNSLPRELRTPARRFTDKAYLSAGRSKHG